MRSSTCNKWLGRCASLLMAFVIGSTLVFAQTKTVTGTIVDDLGEPMIGVNVVVVGTTNGATTDIDGNFSIYLSSVLLSSAQSFYVSKLKSMPQYPT